MAHSMELTVGAILEGKVKSITKFGAFIALPEGRTGMVHISEVAHAYVNDIHDHLTEGQDVKVMVIAVDPAGKINLSIKRTIEPPKSSAGGFHGKPQSGGGSRRPPYERSGQSASRSNSSRSSGPRSGGSREPQSFDDMLKQFMQDSDSKISSIKQYSDHNRKNRRR